MVTTAMTKAQDELRRAARVTIVNLPKSYQNATTSIDFQPFLIIVSLCYCSEFSFTLKAVQGLVRAQTSEPGMPTMAYANL